MDNYQIGLLALIALVVYLLFRKRKKKQGQKIFKYHEHKNDKGFTEKRSYNGTEKCYPDYPAPSPFCDDPSFSRPMAKHREANHEFRMLRMEYDTAIKRHNRTSAKIRRVNAAAREFDDVSGPEMQEVIDLCKRDIQDAPALMEYAKKWAAMQGSKTVYPPQYDSFRRLALIYERQGKYEEAIDVCNQAIQIGLEDVNSNISYKERRAKLIEKARGQDAQRNAAVTVTTPSMEQTKKEVKTTREELETFEIVRAIGAEINVSDRITYKDTLSYFSIQLDGNSRAWICRIKVEAGPKWVTFHTMNNEKEDKVRISSPKDLYQYKEKIISVIQSLM